MLKDELIPSEAQVYAWIEQVFRQGVRRPGYPADRWTEAWLLEQFRSLGLEQVRTEPVELPYWEPRHCSLTITTDDQRLDLPCFPLPHSAPTSELEGDLVLFDPEAPERARGAFVLYDVQLSRVPLPVFVNMATWHYDPDGTFPDAVQVLPFGPERMEVLEPAIHAGAAAFIGSLTNYPGDSYQYYVPYDAQARPIPGAWVRGSDGTRLRSLLAQGRARARLIVDTVREPVMTANVIGELAGADDEVVVIGSHHDGPWSSAVEDASGISLVLAQAAYWSRVPQAERPHRLVFLLTSGHMAGGAGTNAFIAAHGSELERVVLEVHLEHAANEVRERDGALVATGQPEPRWWFTTRIPRLEASVREAIEAERLGRSLILRPDVFGPRPTTDGGAFHLVGVPLVNYLTAPFYLFDAMDTLDKIHRPSLVPVTRAAARIIAATAGVSAATMRAERLPS